MTKEGLAEHEVAPKGRDEDGLKHTMAWVRHHDRYEPEASAKTIPAPGSCRKAREEHGHD